MGQAAHAQETPEIVDIPVWFVLADPDANKTADAAVEALTEGLADVLSGFAKGRGTNRAIDPAWPRQPPDTLKTLSTGLKS
jgi:hypothetical protein